MTPTPPNPDSSEGALLALAAKVKASPENMTSNILDAAWYALASCSADFRAFACTPVSGFGTNGGRFGALLDARAYTDAALMLLPTDGSMSLLDIEMGFEPKNPEVWPAISVRWYPPHQSGPNWHALVSSAATLPLTIAAAALEAPRPQPFRGGRASMSVFGNPIGTLNGLRIVDSEVIGDPYEDWSQVRSPARARRRRRKHPQRIVTRYRANGKAYHDVNQNCVYMHPHDRMKLERTIREQP